MRVRPASLATERPDIVIKALKTSLGDNEQSREGEESTDLDKEIHSYDGCVGRNACVSSSFTSVSRDSNATKPISSRHFPPFT